MSSKIKVDLLADGNLKPIHCRISGGQLISALSPVKIGESIKGRILCAGRVESVGRFFIADSDKVYVSVSGAEFYELGTLSGDAPFIIEETSGSTCRAVICNGKSALAHSGDSYRGTLCGIEVSCGVMHCGRLFGGNGYTLRWSGEGGIEDGEQKLNGAGYIVLEPTRGKILNILEYGEKLVIVREFGLTLVSMFGNPEHFSVEMTGTDCDRIFKNTAQVVFGKLLFFTESGLKSFDGSRIEVLPHRYAADIASPTCSAEFSGLYFLGCESKFLGRRCVLCYNPADGESYLVDVRADAISSADCVYVFGEDGLFRLCGESGFSFVANFYADSAATLTEIHVDGTCDLEVGNGKVSRTFEGARGKIRPRLRGRTFTVKGKGLEDIKSLTACVEVCDAI